MDDAFQSGFASAFLDVLFSRLTDFIANEINIIMNADESARKLETAVIEAQHELNKIDHFQSSNALLRRADEVANFCYDAEDLIDDIDREIKKRKSACWSKNPVRCAVKPVKNLLIPRRIDELQKKLVRITEDLRRNLDLCQPQLPLSSVSHSERSFSYNHQLKLIGRDYDISCIVKTLTCLEECDSNGISIVGMRGLGKTALADNIINHAEIRAKFPLIFRLTMSGNDFNEKEMIAKLVKVHGNISTRTQNAHSLKDLLSHEGWLFLIDNLCELDTMAWRNFQTSYLTTKGRKLLITTLNPKVATVAQTKVYSLKPLSDEHCRELVSHELTLLRNGCSIPPHECINLAKISYGLPLVAAFLGWSQAKRLQEKDQLPIGEDLWNCPTFRKEILPVLTSTFSNLKPLIKRCFAYLSLFPQDYQFDAKELILLWLGEGFIQPHASRLEQNGWDSFNDLLEQSILQPLPANSHGLTRYEMHKFTHYFARVAGLKTYIQLLGDGASSSNGLNANTRHLSLSQKIPPCFWDNMKHLGNLRTFLSLYDIPFGQINKIPRDLFKKLSRLRVLSLTRTDITELPGSINRLKRLRYLDVSNTPIQKLPENLSDVSTLQILKLKKNHGIPQLPINFCILTNLVFIDWDKGDIRRLQSQPYNIGSLISLRTLPLFIVGDNKGYRITELKDMKHLQGSLCISNLEMVKDGAEATEAMLSSKSLLQRLELEWITLGTDPRVGNVLEGLEPHDRLNELQIVNYGFDTFPLWLSHSLPLLETLKLKGCHCKIMPALGQLQALKTLHLEELSKLTYLDHNFRGTPTSGTNICFPSLESLTIHHMAKLREMTGLGANDMPRLCKIEIMDCPNLERLPSLNNLTSLIDMQIDLCQTLRSLPQLPASLKSLTISRSDLLSDRCQVGGDDWLKIDCILKVHIDGVEVPTSVPHDVDYLVQSESRNYILQGFQFITNGIRSIFGRLF